jgi:hypothetical protein
MRVTRRERVEKVIKALEDQINALKSIGLHDCASLIRIAWLDLRRRNDRISIKELQALCDRVTGGPQETMPAVPKKSPRRAAEKPKKSARIIDMRAWRSRIPR